MIIENQKELEAFCKKLSQQPFITVDTEFLREKTYYPKLCLVQLSGPDKEARAVDPLMQGIDLKPVFALLKNEKILKIFHAGRQDLEIFYTLSGTLPKPYFDTQIAAMVCGYGEQIGYETLVREVAGASIDKSSQYADWSRRPLNEKQLNYALADVTHLVDIYKSLSAQLKKTNRTHWVLEEEEILTSPETYIIDTRAVWQRIKIKSPKPKALAILRECADWREQEAQRKDVPKNWIVRDETLADLAHQAPASKDQLSKVRGISDGIVNGKVGKALLNCVKAALDTPQDEWPKPEKRKPIPPAVGATLELLKMLLRICAAENDVAAKLISDAEDLQHLAMGQREDLPALKGWRHEIFGDAALKLLDGKIAVGLNKGKIELFEI